MLMDPHSEIAQQHQSHIPDMDLWRRVLNRMREEHGEASFASWFQHMLFVERRGDTLCVVVPSRFIREWIITNYYSKIKQVLLHEDSSIRIFDIRVQAKTGDAASNAADAPAHNDNELSTQLSHILDTRFTFESFVTSPSNMLAYVAAQGVAAGQHISAASNSLYIHGAVGMGKTHLMQAISHYVATRCPDRRVLYLSAERFMHQYIVAVKHSKVVVFRDSLRSLDILLVDDIQFLCGKAATQQEFANTLNAFIEAGKTVVIAADRSPYGLDIDNRTKSRLCGGMVVDIKAPDLEMRLRIVQSKANVMKRNIPYDVLEFVATNVTASVRELEASLHKLVAFAEIAQQAISIDLAKNVLKDCLNAHEVMSSIDRIIETVVDFYGITRVELTSKSRTARFVRPRQVAALLCKKMTSRSLHEIGVHLGKRDHATVIYSIKSLEQKMMTDSSIAEEIDKISGSLARL